MRTTFDFATLSPEMRALVPGTKMDILTAQKAVRAGYPVIKPVLPVLLFWLQDYNWPVAQVLAPFLASIGAPLKEEVVQVLQSGDLIWKHWILDLVVNTPDLTLANALEQELEMLRTRYEQSPSPLNDDDETVQKDIVRILNNLRSSKSIVALQPPADVS